LGWFNINLGDFNFRFGFPREHTHQTYYYSGIPITVPLLFFLDEVVKALVLIQLEWQYNPSLYVQTESTFCIDTGLFSLPLHCRLLSEI
jgi:hypothetical protein